MKSNIYWLRRQSSSLVNKPNWFFKEPVKNLLKHQLWFSTGTVLMGKTQREPYQTLWRSMASSLQGLSFRTAHRIHCGGPLGTQKPSFWGKRHHKDTGSKHPVIWSNWRRGEEKVKPINNRKAFDSRLNLQILTDQKFMFPASSMQRSGLWASSFRSSCLAWLW